ncbi:UNKNOWN [Stylonychia lemnae]|uniref:Uncharacterized protein n=1 Tax=Stylonychia lemnae TaxID=5949 RepID=A0A078AJ48_STYLE|nr:UNKNOWN [Stylonychia lemnae]|eukprot:CDW80828.1 UNKNOWN [Stylonychia lemnae]
MSNSQLFQDDQLDLNKHKRCNLHDQYALYLSGSKKQLLCYQCISDQMEQGIVQYTEVRDEMATHRSKWTSLHAQIIDSEKDHEKFKNQISQLMNQQNTSQVQQQPEEQKSSFDSSESHQLTIQSNKNQILVQNLQKLLGQRAAALPDIVPTLLAQADAQIQKDQDAINHIREQFNLKFIEINKLFDDYDILGLVRESSHQIKRFLTGIKVTQNEQISDLKMLRQLEGLAKLSIKQKQVWAAEEELLKMYCKPEQRDTIIQIFKSQNNLLEQLEKSARDIEGKIRKQEDDLNYLKFKLSRSTDQLNSLYQQDTQIAAKYTKYVSDKVVISHQKPNISTSRQEFINQLINHSNESSRFPSEDAFNGLAAQRQNQNLTPNQSTGQLNDSTLEALAGTELQNRRQS